jgi:hypothetical protein
MRSVPVRGELVCCHALILLPMHSNDFRWTYYGNTVVAVRPHLRPAPLRVCSGREM